jgi:isohexenylglutaconyl-CoA hydratase
MTEVSIGVAPAQIAPFVIRRLGATRARWLMQCTARLDANAAVGAGLADVVVDPQDLPSRLRSDLGRLAAAEPAALRATARIVDGATNGSLDAALDLASLEFATLLRGDAPLEGIAATRERRRTAWTVEVPELPDFL